MTTTTCQYCGNDSQEKTCWLCELESKGGYIYYREIGGKVVAWSRSGDDFEKKIEAKDFCDLVREQYQRCK